MKDPLDTRIDTLLASRPLRPSGDFAARVLEAAEADTAARGKHPLSRLIAFTLSIAAAAALTFSLLQLDHGSATATTEAPALTTAEAQEIFLLEESVADLSTTGASGFAGQDLLTTLDALYLEI